MCQIQIPKIEDEFTLVNELKRIISKTTEECLDIPQQIYVKRDIELYTNCPSIYLQENGIEQLTSSTKSP